MGGCHMNLTPPRFLLLFFLVILGIPIRTLGDDPCEKAFCGEGTCVPSTSTPLGYDCLCNRGWKKFGFVDIACVVPNCTIDISCGSPAPPPPPPPPSLLPPFDPLNICNYFWCGDGTCVVNGTLAFYCQCNAGSTNLFNLTAFPCIGCLGIDCNALLGLATPPPPPSSGTSESPSPSRSPPVGSHNVAERWSCGVVLLSTIILAMNMYA